MFLLNVFVFLFGLAVGSFLNAVIYRMGESFNSAQGKKSAFKGRSYCPQCKHQLSWQDLIPVASFVMLGGRCRYCGKPISWQYPLVELATAIIFVAIFNFEFSPSAGGLNEFLIPQFLNLLYLAAVASLLIILFVYDLRHYILPDKVLLPAIFISGIWYVVSRMFFQSYTRYEILNTLYAALGTTAFFLAVFLFSRGRAMGFGDVKLAFFMGLFLGWPNILVALFAAFFAGAIIGIGLIAFQKKELKSEIPFGPFLIAGTFLALFWGSRIVEEYNALLN
ncbi:MAG TPA: prepilin peptidase [Candidatus Wildermuthbacteria bacterium]|nr:MAG: Type 4 prepilin-like protein leader peptide-processing enzyme [Parcubacteria group bacterium GW2011_GWB1_49_12]KKW08350.1 MAG: Type 4 prepilin-like protein leader peptide-processing enzyme [Parcubacteria group bacterium GW2011_GWA1_49_26]OHA60946.1 MAG: hypothetical protein A2109_01875 [Candidatus Wildermuthbacteria bacterium GWA1_49_26]OHA69686.1 MAG: hypothetical protein A3D63_03690 [Candidatus Wildermuthbacteria bacterium RIFCSPHIGHO2_02_FULL_49_17]OHA72612.1 MAG: hypothetical protei